MATMPGLPMFGHGQVEGFTEKYGMEYRRAYCDEHPTTGWSRRHEREIFPLLHRRHLFAEVDNFLLYDFYTTGGGGQRGRLRLLEPRAARRAGAGRLSQQVRPTAGWIRRAAVTGRSLGEGLGVGEDGARFLVLRDWRGGLEYLRSASSVAREGLYLRLDAYKTYVFAEIKDLVDHTDGRWRRLADWLDGRGVPSLDVAMREMELAPFHAALARGRRRGRRFARRPPCWACPTAKAAPKLGAVDAVDRFLAGVRPRLAGGRWIDEWLADRALPNADLAAVRLRMAAARDGLSPDLLRDEHFRRLIGVNEHEGVEYFNKEALRGAVKCSFRARADRRSAASSSGSAA